MSPTVSLSTYPSKSVLTVETRVDLEFGDASPQVASSGGSGELSLTHGIPHVVNLVESHPNFGASEDTIIGKEGVSSSQGTFLVDFEKDDPRNPFNFSRSKKWIITAVFVSFTGFVGSNGVTFALGTPSMMRDLHCSELQAAAGTSIYSLGFAVAPLFLASFSEEFGRNTIYIVTGVIFWLCFLPVALAKNITTVLIFRFIGGAAGSTGATMVGGSLADIWVTSERGTPMMVFSLAVFVSTGLGPVISGWVEVHPRMEWRWIQWLHFITTGLFTILLIVVLKETRGPVILAREAQRLRKETGDKRYRPIVERPSLKKLIKISLTRPFVLLTEPVGAAFGLWSGFAYGSLYGILTSLGPVFHHVYGFNNGQAGSVFASVCVAAFLGLGCNLCQENLYARYFKKYGPEARLFAACAAGIIFPAGCFMYAWSADSSQHWIAPTVGLTVLMMGVYIIYTTVFNYLADCYLTYASSALAGQGLCRNLAAAAFPLFANQMRRKLTHKWAGTLFGCIAVALGVVPFVLFFWGAKIRARSRFARKMAELEAERSAK